MGLSFYFVTIYITVIIRPIIEERLAVRLNQFSPFDFSKYSSISMILSVLSGCGNRGTTLILISSVKFDISMFSAGMPATRYGCCGMARRAVVWLGVLPVVSMTDELWDILSLMGKECDKYYV